MRFTINDTVNSDFPAAVRGDLQIGPNQSLTDLVGRVVEFTITYDASDVGPDLIMNQGVIAEAD